MKRILLAFTATMLLFSSCGTNKTVSENPKLVSFTEARNYFHIGDETKPVIKKITSQEDLEEEFGEAAFMGKDGEPTKIDFKKKFAIAYILPETKRKTELVPLSLIVGGKRHLILRYKLEQGKAQSFSTQPFFIIIVDKKYEYYKIKEDF